jgi:uncharacterized membrane protein
VRHIGRRPGSGDGKAARRGGIGHDRRAATALLAAVILCALLFFTGLTVDFGLALLRKRQLQAATDFAALAAAQNNPKASTIVAQMLAANGFATAQVTNLTTGSYVANQAIPPGQRYVANQQPANAVQLATATSVPMHFVSAIVPHAQLTVPAQAGAVQVTEAGLVAGSGLISVGGPSLPNAILGGMLGTSLTLDAVSYNGLANANINALDFLDALAAQAHVTAGTYGQLLSGNLGMGQVINAEITALNESNSIGGAQLQAIGALQQISAQLAGSPSVALGSLFNAGLWSTAQIGTIDRTSALSAMLNVYQVTSFAAQIANGSNLVSGANTTTIPGVANVSVAVTAIEPPQGAYYAVGPAGTSVHTAQIRMQLTLNLLGSVALPLLGTFGVSLPVYEEVASGTASIAQISCGANPVNDATVAVAAISGVSTAYVGQVQPGAMTNFSLPVSVSPAPIITGNLLSVTGQAKVTMQGGIQALYFNQQQITSLTPQTVSSTNMTSSFLAGLQPPNLVLQSNPPVPLLTPLLTPVLAPAFAGLDAVSDQVLSTLGVRVGYLDVTVNGVRCGVPALIQ